METLFEYAAVISSNPAPFCIWLVMMTFLGLAIAALKDRMEVELKAFCSYVRGKFERAVALFVNWGWREQ